MQLFSYNGNEEKLLSSAEWAYTVLVISSLHFLVLFSSNNQLTLT